MGDVTKQVRVDNWGIFFLQRLQVFFSKTDYCDMTLQFEGNVQLKVHRLVMNACTEYFSFLEQTCGTDDNVIMMPADLQADVIVPIVNFMYTGMLEFHLSIFERLYKTAQAMNITILTKLLDAQKLSTGPGGRSKKKQHGEAASPHFSLQVPKKSATPKPAPVSDLPATLPGRKLPIWKRKSVPGSSSGSSSQSFIHSSPLFLSGAAETSSSKWSCAPSSDPLSLDNTPKPTRFEWPDDDLPTINPMDTSFEEISYTSKPLLTQEEENRSTSCFDDLKQTPNNKGAGTAGSKRKSTAVDMEEMKNYVKEQKIRSGLQDDDDDEDVDNDFDNSNDSSQSQKRRATGDPKKTASIKRVRFESDQDGKGSTTISIATDGKSAADVDHTKIVSEILKKYPQLVKKNKNIRLKILTKGSKGSPEQAANQNKSSVRMKKDLTSRGSKKEVDQESNAPWVCERCSSEDDPMEFILYYLYRKHMTDVHSEKFDSRLCKYCGHWCNKHNLMMYHLYTKHAMKPPPSYNFPKCNLCPYIALSANILARHKMRHNKNEIQCVECKLAFSSRATLNTHLQITGHNGKRTGKSSYDCQYCTKRYTSAPNLFSHVKSQHRDEARRDGIVSIDETDELDDSDDQEDDTSKEEYILPEIISDVEPAQPKKVNILSDVKVQNQQVHHLPLEPSSEAEALTNVATGIATSLGLVDIVVLNENQQFLLQPEQQTFSGQQRHDQTEFILPELTGGEGTHHHFTTHGQNEVLTQSMLSGGDIGSTDELVMVLTDHDYGDGNQEDANNDNSNIVVLYSHPVDGQQDQFITTTQGNIMVNSQTGMFEIRNGATMTSTGGNTMELVQQPQPVPEVSDVPIESIEMIQREIESHHSNAREITYDVASKPLVAIAAEPTTANPDDDETTLEIPEEHLTDPVDEVEEEHHEDAPPQQEEQETPAAAPAEEIQLDPSLVPEDSSLVPSQEENGSETKPDENPEPDGDQTVPQTHHDEEEARDDLPQDETEQSEETPEESVPEDQTQAGGGEEDKVASPREETPNNTEALNESIKETTSENEPVAQDDALHKEESQDDNSTSQDDNSHSSREATPAPAKKAENQSAISHSILDDWGDDTDSQPSGQQQQPQQEEPPNPPKEVEKVPGETVDKLMDDWEEEEEESEASKKESDE